MVPVFAHPRLTDRGDNHVQRSSPRFCGYGPECRVGARSSRGSCRGSIGPCTAWFCRRAIGGVQRATAGGCREPQKKAGSHRRRNNKSLRKGRRKYIYEQVAAGLAGLRWVTMKNGWANCYYTATCQCCRVAIICGHA